MGRKARKTVEKELRRSLVENLEARGLIEEVYLDKVSEYMDLWNTRQDLEEDIKARGVSIHDSKRGMMMENRSISMAVQVSKQMLNIYAALGFRGIAERSDAIGGEEDDEM